MTRPVMLLAFAAALLAACGSAPAASPRPSSSSAAAKPAVSAAASPAASAPAASAAASAAAAAAGSAGAASRVAIQYGLLASVSNAVTFVPAEKGEFAAQGMDVSIQPFTDTVQIMVSVGSGQLQMGNITIGAAALNALKRGLDLKLLASSTQDPPGHGSLVPAVARTDLYDSGALTTPAQLKGRKFAINARGNVQEYQMYKLLGKGGLKASDIDVVTMPFPDMVTALGNKTLDAGNLLEPAATQAISKGYGKILSDDHSPNTQLAIVVANAKFAEQHRDAIERFLQIHVQTIRKFDDGGLKKDDQALALIEKYTKATPELTRQVPDAYWPKDGKINVDSLQDQQSFYLTNKSVDYAQPITLDKFIDYSYLDAALKKIGG